MTPEEIKKIAEEYAKYVNSAYLSDKAEKEALRVIQWLTERFYLVEKGKARKVYSNTYHARYEHSEQAAMRRLYFALFGPDIRKEEEE